VFDNAVEAIDKVSLINIKFLPSPLT